MSTVSAGEAIADPSAAHTVYAFLSLDRGVEMPTLAPFKATRDTIERHFGGRLIEGTAETVCADELDAQGRYVRRPTGWGDLGD